VGVRAIEEAHNQILVSGPRTPTKSAPMQTLGLLTFTDSASAQQKSCKIINIIKPVILRNSERQNQRWDGSKGHVVLHLNTVKYTYKYKKRHTTHTDTQRLDIKNIRKWRLGLVRVGLDQRSYSTPGPRTPTGVGDRLRAGKPPGFVATQANSGFYPQRDGK